jgi:hypothetical protein
MLLRHVRYLPASAHRCSCQFLYCNLEPVNLTLFVYQHTHIFHLTICLYTVALDILNKLAILFVLIPRPYITFIMNLLPSFTFVLEGYFIIVYIFPFSSFFPSVNPFNVKIVSTYAIFIFIWLSTFYGCNHRHTL